MRLVFLLFAPMVLALLAAPLSTAQLLSCDIVDDCQDVAVMELAKTENAHAALIGSGTGYMTLCCSGIPGLKAGTGEYQQDIVSLFSETNSHVEDPVLGNYDNTVSFAIDGNPQVTAFSCQYRAGGCLTGEDCILSLFNQTNSHAGLCGYYDNSICCEITTDTTPPTITDDHQFPGDPARARALDVR